jgi:hypothetical protein
LRLSDGIGDQNVHAFGRREIVQRTRHTRAVVAWRQCNAVFENHQLLLQTGISTGFFHVEFTKGVYWRRMDYGQCGI